MIQTLNPYPSKTDEIMSRYRPIAPKPQIPLTTTDATTTTTNGGFYDGGASVPEKFRQSPYLRNIWSHLQARPTRTRKRGRSTAMPTMLRKQQQQLAGPGPRPSTAFIGLCPSPSIARTLSFHAFAMDATENPVTLPLLTCSPPFKGERMGIDLNTVAADGGDLEERDLRLQLQIRSNTTSTTNVTSLSPSPSSSSSSSTTSRVISPRPVRPVGSSITVVGPISEDYMSHVAVKAVEPEEVEAAAEAEELPAVISDRNNKVRVVNSAYKELVGQPECPWLDSMVSSSIGKIRISGEVMIHVADPGMLPVSGNGFSCWVQVEWESNGKKNSVNAFCEVVRLACESKDYLFSWRFHTREVSPSASKV